MESLVKWFFLASVIFWLWFHTLSHARISYIGMVKRSQEVKNMMLPYQWIFASIWAISTGQMRFFHQSAEIKAGILNLAKWLSCEGCFDRSGWIFYPAKGRKVYLCKHADFFDVDLYISMGIFKVKEADFFWDELPFYLLAPLPISIALTVQDHIKSY